MSGPSGADLASRGVGLSRRALLVAGLAVAGCGQVERPTIRTISHESSSDPEAQALQEILDRRAKALRNDDERTFLADLDSRSSGLIAQQKMVFGNLRQLEFTRFAYVTEQASRVSEGTSHVFSRVIQITQLTTDAGPGGVAPAETFEYTLAPRDGKLVITKIRGSNRNTAADLRLNSPMADAPWNFTALRIIRAGKVWLAGDSSVKNLDRYADAAKTHLHEVESLWGNRIKFPGHILFFTRSTESLKNWFGVGLTGDLLSMVEGLEIPLQGVRKDGQMYDGQYAGSRIVVNLRAAERWDDDPELVMRHELAHAVTARATNVAGSSGYLALTAPRWALEGFARWVETVGNPRRMDYVRYVVRVAVASGNFSGKPPGMKEFYGKNLPFSYDLSASVFAYVDDRKGQDAVVEFYANVIKHAETVDSPLIDKPEFDEICRQVMGVRASVFLQRWATFVRNGAR
ncbi:hypothetical protein [Actinopolymorpha alba]|uniref:hypothetical protein n=1 Tax=Actinopolymorpha alba TaxID=533267 RepID=UPI00037635BA|nr:hypothetical protein [Actinopolymorpha alba]